MEQNIKRLIIRRCALIALVPLLIVIAGHFLVALLPISPRNTLKGLILIFFCIYWGLISFWSLMNYVEDLKIQIDKVYMKRWLEDMLVSPKQINEVIAILITLVPPLIILDLYFVSQ